MGRLPPKEPLCLQGLSPGEVTPTEVFLVWSLDNPFLLLIFSAWKLSFRYLSSSLMFSFFCIPVLPPDWIAALLRGIPYPSGLHIPTALSQHFVHLRLESLLLFFCFKYLKYFKVIHLFFGGRLCWIFSATFRLPLVPVSGSCSLVVVHGLLISTSSLVAEHKL